VPVQSVFQWKDGRGWLVFAGSADSDIRGMALNRGAADGGVACVAISKALNSADYLLDDLEDLGAPSGYIVDLNSEDDALISAKLGEAGIIVITSDQSPNQVRSALVGTALDAVAAAYANGAIILCEGSAAAVFGEWLWDRDKGLIPAFAWLRQTFIVFGDDAHDAGEFARDALREYPAAIVLALANHAAIALGGDGQIEPWGNQRVTIGLGSAYQGGT